MRLRWDTVGKKPKELLGKFAVPLRRKTLIFFDRGSPPLGTLRQSLILILLSFFQKCPTNKNRDRTH